MFTQYVAQPISNKTFAPLPYSQKLRPPPAELSLYDGSSL
jgi:hypothetical protein